MKVVFLDIDGVLQAYKAENRFGKNAKELTQKLSEELNVDLIEKCHSMDVAAVYYDWDEIAMNRIKKILDTTNSKIVVSSDWRDIDEPLKMDYLFKIHGFDKYYVGQTDYYNRLEIPEERKKFTYRTCEILNYLDLHKEITNYVAIDDGYLEEGIEGHFVQTYNLINDEQMKKCIEILNKESEENQKL